MITAKEALELSKSNSDQLAVEALFKSIDPMVRAATASGARSFEVLDPCWTVVELQLLRDEVPSKIILAIDKLIALGYSATLKQVGSPFVPLGMMDDYGNGPNYIKSIIKIQW